MSMAYSFYYNVGGVTMDEWVQIVSNFGFPIACVSVLAWYVNKITNDFRATVEKMSETHKEEVTKLSESIDKLAEKIGG